ncbi:MAG: cytochrome c biogenesis protein ResB [Desulfobacteraceae bacterium]|nr:cytochrome c biogenesis protein ResB [Desulfobacteraceae bacterium]
MKKNASNQGPLNRVWLFFSSVKLTVVVLLSLAFTSIIGTLIPQNASEVFYLKKYGQGWYQVFTSLDIVDMYNSWWFLLLLGLLAVNIIVCSFERLGYTWKIIFPKKVVFRLERFRRLKRKESFACDRAPDDLAASYEAFLEKRIGRVIRETTDTGTALFAETGRWTRIGVYVVHLSIILLLAGAVIGSIWGFKGRVSIPEGDTTDVIELRQGEHEHLTLDFAVRCNSFDVSFYDTGAPKEFKSNITLLEDGNEVLTSDILVNHPLRYKGISLYQSNYGTASARNVTLSVTSRDSGMVYQEHLEFNKPMDLPENQGRFVMERFAPGYNFRGHNLGEVFVGRMIAPDATETSVILPLKFPTFDKMRGGRLIFAVEDFEKQHYTGLQVNKDPGVWYVYAGFALMIIGCWVTFFMSHQSYCVEIKNQDGADTLVEISAVANRNSQSLKLKTAKLASTMKELKS